MEFGERIQHEPRNHDENEDEIDDETESLSSFDLKRRRLSYSTWTQDFRRHGTFCDLKLFAGPDSPATRQYNLPILAHKVILAGGSEFFQELLLSPYGVMVQNNKKELFIEGVTRNALEILIEYMYVGTLDFVVGKLSSNNILDLFTAAQLIRMDEVISLCESQLLNRCQLSVENCVRMLFYAHRMRSSKNPVEFVTNFVLTNLPTVLQTKEFCNLNPDIIQSIIQRGRSSGLASDKDLLVSIKNWLIFNADERKDYLVDMLQHFPVTEHQATLYKIFIEDMEEEFKKVFYDPMMKLLLSLSSTVVSESPVTTTTIQALPSSLISESQASPTSPLTGQELVHHRHKKRSPSAPSPPPRSSSPSSSKRRKSDHRKSRKYRKDDQSLNSSSSSSEATTLVEDAPNVNIIKIPRSRLQENEGGAVMYFFGALNDGASPELWSYDLKNNTSKVLASIHSSRPRNSTLVYHDDGIFLLGGKFNRFKQIEASEEVRVFDTISGTWRIRRRVPAMKRGRFHFPTIILDGHLYVVGGCQIHVGEGRDRGIVTCVERLSLEDRRKWEQMPHLPGPRTNFGVASLKGRLYVVGGGVEAVRRYTDATSRVERLDPETDKWEHVTPMTRRRTGTCAVATDDLLFAIGGRGPSEKENRLSSTEIYCPIKNSWTAGPSMHKARRFASGVYWKAENSIYVVGGDQEYTSQRPTIEKLNLSTMTWEIVAHLRPEGNYCSVAFKI